MRCRGPPRMAKSSASEKSAPAASAAVRRAGDWNHDGGGGIRRYTHRIYQQPRHFRLADYTSTSMITRQWSLGPHRAGSLSARGVTAEAIEREAKTKSSCRVAVSGV